MYYGNGFTHSDCYEMPVYLRRFNLNLLTDLKKAERKHDDQKINTIKSQMKNRQKRS